MRKLLTLIVLISACSLAFPQSPKRILKTDEARISQLLKIRTAEIDSILNDSTLANASNRTLATAKAIKNYIDDKVITAGAVDSTRLIQDSILVYYQEGVEIGRDTLPNSQIIDQGQFSDIYSSLDSLKLPEVSGNITRYQAKKLSSNSKRIDIALIGDSNTDFASEIVDYCRELLNRKYQSSGPGWLQFKKQEPGMAVNPIGSWPYGGLSMDNYSLDGWGRAWALNDGITYEMTADSLLLAQTPLNKVNNFDSLIIMAYDRHSGGFKLRLESSNPTTVDTFTTVAGYNSFRAYLGKKSQHDLKIELIEAPGGESLDMIGFVATSNQDERGVVFHRIGHSGRNSWDLAGVDVPGAQQQRPTDGAFTTELAVSQLAEIDPDVLIFKLGTNSMPGNPTASRDGLDSLISKYMEYDSTIQTIIITPPQAEVPIGNFAAYNTLDSLHQKLAEKYGSRRISLFQRFPDKATANDLGLYTNPQTTPNNPHYSTAGSKVIAEWIVNTGLEEAISSDVNGRNNLSSQGDSAQINFVYAEFGDRNDEQFSMKVYPNHEQKSVLYMDLPGYENTGITGQVLMKGNRGAIPSEQEKEGERFRWQRENLLIDPAGIVFSSATVGSNYFRVRENEHLEISIANDIPSNTVFIDDPALQPYPDNEIAYKNIRIRNTGTEKFVVNTNAGTSIRFNGGWVSQVTLGPDRMLDLIVMPDIGLSHPDGVVKYRYWIQSPLLYQEIQTNQAATVFTGQVLTLGSTRTNEYKSLINKQIKLVQNAVEFINPGLNYLRESERTEINLFTDSLNNSLVIFKAALHTLAESGESVEGRKVVFRNINTRNNGNTVRVQFDCASNCTWDGTAWINTITLGQYEEVTFTVLRDQYAEHPDANVDYRFFMTDRRSTAVVLDDQSANEVDIIDSGSYFSGTEVESALQEVGASLATFTDDQTASEVPIADVDNNYTSTDVEAALSEVDDYQRANFFYVSSTKTVNCAPGPNVIVIDGILDPTVTINVASLRTGDTVRVFCNGGTSTTLDSSSGGFIRPSVGLNESTIPILNASYVLDWDGSNFYKTN